MWFQQPIFGSLPTSSLSLLSPICTIQCLLLFQVERAIGRFGAETWNRAESTPVLCELYPQSPLPSQTSPTLWRLALGMHHLHAYVSSPFVSQNISTRSAGSIWDDSWVCIPQAHTHVVGGVHELETKESRLGSPALGLDSPAPQIMGMVVHTAWIFPTLGR